MQTTFTPRITIFYCINSFTETSSVFCEIENQAEITFVKLPCSSMVKDVFVLRAFEADADAVIILVCPEGQCRFVEGNIRAKKRTTWVCGLLDDIGLDGRRLSLFNVKSGDEASLEKILDGTLSVLEELGPSPVRRN
ncbi:MAG: hydrogenase iron-sulfur subunit [Deltaproteobacteria bacterium]|nr:hydrogenase iron-sulfur subunit [Deltaproteobacteria bacterium]MBW2297172.1 hydrogenase iron-sulfur subunit [Deltaproteobacteria bacterium]MBW2610853.1 hydrogenase iron-sulfur subunit [Deltaproteobacteria bacterium]MBW2632930.1 hydrogenase iron-sulfur subunit [Deltaproteobacteria bacterium]MBW2676605.1 hydrogenase iron-sulfur subunit [Deltaproteobacteria bacterium]